MKLNACSVTALISEINLQAICKPSTPESDAPTSSLIVADDCPPRSNGEAATTPRKTAAGARGRLIELDCSDSLSAAAIDGRKPSDKALEDGTRDTAQTAYNPATAKLNAEVSHPQLLSPAPSPPVVQAQQLTVQSAKQQQHLQHSKVLGVNSTMSRPNSTAAESHAPPSDSRSMFSSVLR